MSKDVSQLLPLTQAHLYILCALSIEAKHGYAIMQSVQEISEGTYRLGPATLYENLAKLLELTFITEVRGTDSEDTRRRCYELTALGKRVVRADLDRLRRLVSRVAGRSAPSAEGRA